jgi:hypothetical protein
MTEKRAHPRETLSAAMICSFDAGEISTFCVVRNVSLQGALVECPLAAKEPVFETGDPVFLSDTLHGEDVLFGGHKAEIVWIYKQFIGLWFEEPLQPSVDRLRQWLVERGLV